MILIFQVLAVILACFAVYFLWSDNGDAVFIVGVLAIVSFLLSIRFQVKVRMKAREAEISAGELDPDTK